MSIVSLPRERWLPVNGWPRYEVSDFGRLRNTDGLILKLRLSNFGYHRIYLSTPGRKTKKGFFVHRLVAEAFISQRPSGMEINHKNGMKTDNRAENLEWVTKSQNAKHAFESGLVTAVGENNGQAKLTEEQAKEVLALRGKKTIFEIGTMYGVSYATVNGIHCGRRWGHLEGSKGKGLMRARGSRVGTSKLNEAQVAEIRALRGTMKNREIAARFGVTLACIEDIYYGKSWKSV